MSVERGHLSRIFVRARWLMSAMWLHARSLRAGETPAIHRKRQLRKRRNGRGFGPEVSVSACILVGQNCLGEVGDGQRAMVMRSRILRRLESFLSPTSHVCLSRSDCI